MINMLVILDKEKLLREKEYEPSQTEEYLTEIFHLEGMTKNQDGWFINGDVEKCGRIISSIWHTDQLRDNIKEWRWEYSYALTTKSLKQAYMNVLHRTRCTQKTS